MADRLTNLPESLQLRILSTLDAKYVVQTSVLSKSWFSLWKSVPILRLNSYDFKNHVDKFWFQSLNTCAWSAKSESVVVLCWCCSKKVMMMKREMFDDLMDFFSKVYSVKSLKVARVSVVFLVVSGGMVSRCPPLGMDVKFEVEDFYSTTRVRVLCGQQILGLSRI
ncbi:F-box/LRR-repeat protein-like protein [Tanacetum coccineum]